jgi:hypothetical protein
VNRNTLFRTVYTGAGAGREPARTTGIQARITPESFGFRAERFGRRELLQGWPLAHVKTVQKAFRPFNPDQVLMEPRIG